MVNGTAAVDPASSETVAAPTSSKPEAAPTKTAAGLARAEKARNDALVAFQVQPNIETATKLASAAGSSPLIQAMTIAILIGLGAFYFRVMRPRGKHGHNVVGE
ncbi:hypothetical protein AB4Y80_15095 [Specibacter sp. RAF43]